MRRGEIEFTAFGLKRFGLKPFDLEPFDLEPELKASRSVF